MCANYCNDFDRHFEVINPRIFKDENGLNVLNLEFKIVSGIDNVKQAIYNRLTTRFGEFALFQYFKYYNDVYDYIGSTEIENGIIGMRIATISCLESEPFVETVNSVVVIPNKDFRRFRIKCNISIIGGETFDIAFVLRNDLTDDSLLELEEELYG